MAVTITSKFYQAAEWKSIEKIVFTSPNMDSPQDAGIRSHILPGQGDLALWYEDASHMYRILPDQSVSPTASGKQATFMAKIDLYPGETFSFVTDSSVKVTLESVDGLETDEDSPTALGDGHVLYYDKDSYATIDGITTLTSGIAQEETDQIVVYEDPFFAAGNARKGSNYNLYWCSSGIYTDSYVDIYYSLNAGLDWISLASGTNNDGVVSFNIPSSTTEAKLKVISSADPSLYAFSDTFTVTTPALDAVKPESSQTINSGNYFRIWWNCDHFYLNESISVHFSSNNGSTWSTLASGINNTGYYDAYIRAVNSSQCKVKILSEENPNVGPEISDTFTCSYSGQTITIRYPDDTNPTVLRGENLPVYWSSTAMQVEVDNLVVSLSTDGGSNYTTLVSGIENTGYYNTLIPHTVSSGTNCKIKISKDDGVVYDESDTFTISDSYITPVYPVSSGITISNDETQTHFWWNTNLRKGENVELYNSTLGSVTSGTGYDGHISTSGIPDNSSYTYNIRHLDDSGTLLTSSATNTVTKTNYVTTSGIIDSVSNMSKSYSCFYNNCIYSVVDTGIHKQTLDSADYEFIPFDSVESFNFLIAVKNSVIYLYDTTQEYFYTYSPTTKIFTPKARVFDLVNIRSFDDSDNYIYGINSQGDVYTYDTVANTWTLSYEQDGTTSSTMFKRGLTKLGDTDHILFLKGAVASSPPFIDLSTSTIVSGTYSTPDIHQTASVSYAYDIASVATTSGTGYIYFIGATYSLPSVNSVLVNAYSYTINGSYVELTDTSIANASALNTYLSTYFFETSIAMLIFMNNYNFDVLSTGSSLIINSDGIVTYSPEPLYEEPCYYMLETSQSGSLCGSLGYKYIPKYYRDLVFGDSAILENDNIHIVGGQGTLLPYYTMDISKGTTISGGASNTIYTCSTYSADSNFYNLSGSCICYDGSDSVYVVRGNYSTDFYSITISSGTLNVLADTIVTSTTGDSELVFNSNANKIYYIPDKSLYISGVFEYDVAGDSWGFLSDDEFSWPQKASLTSLGNYLYFLSNGNDSAFARIDVVNSTAIENLTANGATGYNRTCTDGTNIYAVYQDSPYYVYKYTVATDTWSILHKYDNITNLKYCFYKDSELYFIHGNSTSMSLSKVPTVTDYSTNTQPAGWVSPPDAHTTPAVHGGVPSDIHLDTSTPATWVTPSGLPVQDSPVYDSSFWEILDSAPTVQSPYAKIIQFSSTTGTETLDDTSSLYWWNLGKYSSSWLDYTNSIVFKLTVGECYNCRLTAWDSVTHTSVANDLLASNRCRVHAIAFNSSGEDIIIPSPETYGDITPYEIIHAPAYDQILKGSTFYYGDFDMVYRYQSDIYGDYLMFKPYLYNIDDSIAYGVHDFYITFHYSYT